MFQSTTKNSIKEATMPPTMRMKPTMEIAHDRIAYSNS
jgi:hypothetical protein